MGWERRRNQRFFYKSVRVRGKVKKIYFGKGPVAELAAMAVEQRKQFRKERAAADRRARENYLQVTVEFDRLACELDELVTGMSVVGYREHDRKFKSCNSKKEENTMPIETQSEAGESVKDLADTPENLNAESGDRTAADASIPAGEQPVVESDFRQLVEKANQGDVDAMTQLREVLDSNPEIWQRVGDLAAHARLTLIRLIASGDQLLFESIQRNAVAMEAELLGSSPSSLERLSVERLISTWLQVQHADAMAAASSRENITQVKFWSQQQDRAHRRYVAAVKQLGAVRQLVPRPVSSEQVGAEESLDECRRGETERDDTSATHADSADQDCNGRTARPLNGHDNGQVKSGEAVVNGAHVEPDLCFKETDNVSQGEPANGRPVNPHSAFQ